MEAAQSENGEREVTPTPAGLPLRVWPGWAVIAGYWIAILIAKPQGGYVSFMTLLLASAVGFLSLLLWWGGLSRSRWFERLLVILVAVGVVVVGNLLADKMTAGVPFVIFVMPWILTGWVIVATLVRRRAPTLRLTSVIAVLLMGFIATTSLRFKGVTGAMDSSAEWRWLPRDEDRLLAELESPGRVATAPAAAIDRESLEVTPNDWAEFRGARRDGRVVGPATIPAWDEALPELLWKQRIGPGWSSFSAVGDFAFTQEQRGDSECVVCYSMTDGKELWIHRQAERFEEPAAGAGPRATPTLDAGRLYAMTPSGSVLCLEANDGSLVWHRDLRQDTGAQPPIWGFSASPLVIGEVVAIIACGPNEKGTIAYDRQTGEPRWTAGHGSHSYASCQAAHFGGVPQILSSTNFGIESFRVEDGQRLWTYEWDLPRAARMLQPGLISDSQLLIHSYLDGSRLIDVRHAGDAWEVELVWESRELKSYFNDSVVLGNHLFGFDDKIFTCIDLKTGKRLWKKGRYGHGQVLLVEAARKLIILSESGELVLLDADPQEHREQGRFAALDGKTWNHPVLVGNRLLVRNASEMACYRIATESSP